MQLSVLFLVVALHTVVADYYCTVIAGKHKCLWCAHGACFGKKSWYEYDYCQERCPETYEPVDHSAGAYKASRQLLGGIDRSVDPCDNFYNFACGKWMKDNPASEDNPAVTVFTAMADRIAKDLITVVEEQMLKPYDKNSWKGKAFKFYDKCLKAASDPASKNLNTADFVAILENLGGWPMINFTTDDSSLFNFGGLSGKLFFETSISTIFTSPQIRHNGISITRGYPRSKSRAEITSYRKILVQAANDAADYLGLAIDEDAIEARINETLAFGDSLFHLKFVRSYKKYDSLKSFGTKYPALGVQKYIEALTTPGVYRAIPEKFGLQVSNFDDETMQILDDFLSNSKPETVQNWIISVFVTRFFQQTPGLMESYGIPRVKSHKGSQDVNLTCIQTLLQSMDLATGRLNAEYIEPETLKLTAATMGQYIVEAYHKQMGEVSWLDESSKQNVFNKLNGFGISIGWPDWIMDDLALDEWYKEVDVYKNQSFTGLKNQVTVAKNYRKAMFIVHPEFTQLQMFPSPLDVINAEYDPMENHLWILAGILSQPYFDNNFPMALNFGGVGIVMGHEMGHGYDRDGVLYDYKGRNKPILSTSSAAKFMELTNCLVNDYNHYCVAKDVCENGLNSITENEADVLGLRMTHSAYKLWLRRQGKAVRLPFLEEYSSEQLLFINFARSLCGSYTLEEMKYATQAVHSISPVRVLGATRNLPAFASAFNCPSKAYMNPSSRCMVWN